VPRISVLLPARNAAATLVPAVRSILRQTHADLELVAVDDGSTDGTRGILERCRERDPRVRIVDGPGRGIVAALEAGRARCTGAWIARMDADDVSHPRRLAEQLARLEAEPSLAGLGTRAALFPRGRVGEGMRLYVSWIGSLISPEEVARERFVESPLVHPAVILRADALDRIGGYVERGWPEDYDLWLRLLGSGARLANLPAVRFFWRDHGSRLTRTDPRYGKDRHLALKAHHLARGPLAAARMAAVWGAGPTGKALAAALAAHGVEVAYFVDVDGKKIGRRRRGAPILGPEELPPPGGPLLLVAVAARGARALVRAHLAGRGYREGVDFFCCA
jgi:glycosyltransferase involved in cell wall biosynthesis